MPKPDVPALAELVPAVVESIAGAIAEESMRVVVVVDESTVDGVVIVDVESVVVVLSELLLQAARLPAIAIIANTFFMFLVLLGLNFTF